MAHRRTVVSTFDAKRVFGTLAEHGADLRSPEIVRFTDGPLSGTGSFLVADPTGHVLEIRQRGDIPGSP